MSQVLSSKPPRLSKDQENAQALSIATSWLKEVNDAATSGDVDAFVELFRADGWLRGI